MTMDVAKVNLVLSAALDEATPPSYRLFKIGELGTPLEGEGGCVGVDAPQGRSAGNPAVGKARLFMHEDCLVRWVLIEGNPTTLLALWTHGGSGPWCVEMVNHAWLLDRLPRALGPDVPG
jgi:hypothetical protein